LLVVSAGITTVVSLFGAIVVVSVATTVSLLSVFLSPLLLQAAKATAIIAIANTFFIVVIFVIVEIFQDLIPEIKKGNPGFKYFF